MIDVNKIRADFPILNRKVNGKPLVYFDNGATTQKPKQVIDAVVNYYSEHNANIHRGVHTLSREATELFEEARKTVSKFIGAETEEIVFTAGTTDSINIVAAGLELPVGSEIIITEMEHHSNILPWQLWCEKNEGKLKVIPVEVDGTLDIGLLESLITPQTKVLAVTHVSNTLGVINPVDALIKIAKQYDLIVLVDGAQSVPHMKIDVKELGADFYVFSGHKVYAPTGTGVLWMNKQWVGKLKLSRSGGGTIKTVSFDKTDYVEGALRYEPGTPNIEGVLGLASALKYVNEIGIEKIAKHEHTLLKYATERLNEIPEVEIYANHLEKAAVISFNVKGAHPFDVGTLLDKYGIAVRTGHHCTQPLMARYKIPGTVRASFAMYNTLEEVNIFIEALQKSIKMLS
ncbi:MAG: SufS family cysteine desulfurase [Bacteroidetes bacterium]|nr:SufS family cysteine desulfurase [Bacteroidota bacterium]